MILRKKNDCTENGGEGQQWLYISDMMSGLMIIFLLVAVGFMMAANKSSEEKIADTKTKINKLNKEINSPEKIREDFYKELLEIMDELNFDEAEVDKKQLIIRFPVDNSFEKNMSDNPLLTSCAVKNNDVERNLCIISTPTKEFANNAQVLVKRIHDLLEKEKKYEQYIIGMEIMGHTSSDWKTCSDDDLNCKHLNNMKLSQQRSEKVLQTLFAPSNDENTKYHGWLRNSVTAAGYANMKPLPDEENKKNIDKQKRVEFRMLQNVDLIIRNVKEIVK